jgi:phospho-N-acetylmuramoyl-pentapeptide-transferase
MSKRRGRSLGLKARHKLLGQFLIAGAFAFWLWTSSRPNITTDIWLSSTLHFALGPFYYVLAMIWVIGFSNAANLADGLDGLAGGLSALTALGLAWTVGSVGLGFEHLHLFGYAVAGACLGFLCYNAHPARVFMGDTGSLAIGAGFAAMAIVGKQEILLLIIGAVFMAEMLSVVIQVGVFKATGGKGKGRRVFKMAPLHHHFELTGWPETLVVARFLIAGALALALGLLCAPYLSSWMVVR